MSDGLVRNGRHWESQGAWFAALAIAVAIGLSTGRGQEPAPGEADEKAALPRVGRLISVPAPITSTTVNRISDVVRRFLEACRQKNEKPVLIFEIGKGGNKLGVTFDLADYISTLPNVETVAYLPEGCQGHSLLLAMACEEIAMSPEAEIGQAGIDEPMITDAMRSNYREIADRRRTVPTALALGMLDPQLEVWKVETETSTEFVLTENIEELRLKRAFVLPAAPLIPKGEVGQFKGHMARELHIVNYLAEDRGALVRALDLPREAALSDPAGDGQWRAVRVDVKGPITGQLASQVQSVMDDEIRAGTNFFCLSVDSPGGSPQDTIGTLANFLTSPALANRRTVAYITKEARGDAAILAMACDEVVMFPDANLGGDGAFELAPADVPLVVDSIRQICKSKFRSWSLPAAFVNPDLGVFRYQNKDGRVEYFCEQEASEQPQPADWRKGDEITQRGKLLRLDGKAALHYRLANHTVQSFAEFRAAYGLENDPRLAEPGWADVLIDALTAPEVAWLLLFIGGAALYAELHSPGVGVGAFIAAVCFVTFFWAKFLGGTAGWLEVLLFVTGLVCVLLELFVLPGFGIFGLGGGLLIVASLILASQTFTQLPRNSYQLAELRNSVLVVVGAAGGIMAAIGLLNRYLPRTPGLSRMVLAPPTQEEQAAISRREAVASYEYLVGREGIATTQLTPAGKARFDGQLIDVISDGELIPRGERIVVVEAHGNHVLVKQATGSAV